MLDGTDFHHRYIISHLKVPVHDVMLVDVTDALQDLIDAVAGRDRGGGGEIEDTSVNPQQLDDNGVQTEMWTKENTQHNVL